MVKGLEIIESYIFGLDIGQQNDFTALIGLKKCEYAATPEEPDLTVPETDYHVGHIERFELGTSYPNIAKRVQAIVNSRPRFAGAMLAIDQTGVGRPVVDIFRLLPMQCSLIPITITGGHNASEHDDGWHVPKKDLVGVVQVLLSSQRLKFPRKLAGVDVLVAELQSFKVKITAAANEQYGEWRIGKNDDTVLGSALGLWAGENLSYPSDNAFGGTGERNRMMTARAPEGVWGGE